MRYSAAPSGPARGGRPAPRAAAAAPSDARPFPRRDSAVYRYTSWQEAGPRTGARARTSPSPARSRSATRGCRRTSPSGGGPSSRTSPGGWPRPSGRRPRSPASSPTSTPHARSGGGSRRSGRRRCRRRAHRRAGRRAVGAREARRRPRARVGAARSRSYPDGPTPLEHVAGSGRTERRRWVTCWRATGGRSSPATASRPASASSCGCGPPCSPPTCRCCAWASSAGRSPAWTTAGSARRRCGPTSGRRSWRSRSTRTRPHPPPGPGEDAVDADLAARSRRAHGRARRGRRRPRRARRPLPLARGRLPRRVRHHRLPCHPRARRARRARGLHGRPAHAAGDGRRPAAAGAAHYTEVDAHDEARDAVLLTNGGELTPRWRCEGTIRPCPNRFFAGSPGAGLAWDATPAGRPRHAARLHARAGRLAARVVAGRADGGRAGRLRRAARLLPRAARRATTGWAALVEAGIPHHAALAAGHVAHGCRLLAAHAALEHVAIDG